MKIEGSVLLCSVAQLCPTLYSAMDCSMPGFPVHHQLPELTPTHVHWVGMPSNHLILCNPLLLQPAIILSIRVFSNKTVLISGQSIGVSGSASILPMNIQVWFPLSGLIWSPCCPRDSQVSSLAPQFKSINSSAFSFLYSLTLTSITWLWEKP